MRGVPLIEDSLKYMTEPPAERLARTERTREQLETSKSLLLLTDADMKARCLVGMVISDLADRYEGIARLFLEAGKVHRVTEFFIGRAEMLEMFSGTIHKEKIFTSYLSAFAVAVRTCDFNTAKETATRLRALRELPGFGKAEFSPTIPTLEALRNVGVVSIDEAMEILGRL